jgi:hypothetical protein
VSRALFTRAVLALALAGCGGAIGVDLPTGDATDAAPLAVDDAAPDAGDVAPDCATATGYYVDDAGILWGYRCLPSKPL